VEKLRIIGRVGRVRRLPPGSSQRSLDFNYQDFVNLRYALQLMDNARLELQQGQDSGNGSVITRLNGKLSLETVNSFIQTMRKEPAQHLVLDMSGVAFLDSSGVGALVSLFVTRKHAGKTLALANLTKQAIAVLQVSGLLKLIPAYPTVEAAAGAR
jgi:anti-sigma B factor antagonist